MVNVEGRFLERPAMEGARTEVSLVVDAFIAIHPENSCPPVPDEPLLGTYWKLVEVDEHPVKTPAGVREIHMILSRVDDEPGVKGFGGCNRFFGAFEFEGESLTFRQMGKTMMACVSGMDIERAYLDALGRTERHVITGQTMAIYQGDTVLARFEAVHF